LGGEAPSRQPARCPAGAVAARVLRSRRRSPGACRPINFVHIEFGEINRRGEAVGYHHRPNGVDPPGARVVRVVQPPDSNGVYRARVTLRDPASGAWLLSAFYPDAMTPDEVVDAILGAFHASKGRQYGQFVGPSGRGFAIEGWSQGGRINVAYPLRGP
jgi:hypothetical protein